MVISAKSLDENPLCVAIGPCVKCSQEELSLEYCKSTGKKERIECRKDGTDYGDYRSCEKTSEDDQFEVVVFQVLMAIVGGLAYWGVQNRKKNAMTLFDFRKLR
jgi:hypothetical protein